MKKFFYNLLVFFTKFLGRWIFSFFNKLVTTGFFVFGRKRVRNSTDFYKLLFPGKSWFFYQVCAWKQYHNFSKVYEDRIFIHFSNDISYESHGWENLEKASIEKKGGIILMSHMGNWEAAALFFKKRGLDLMLYMGIKEKEQLEDLQKKGLVHSGIKIVAVDHGGGSPFDLIEGVQFLKKGGLVSLTADRIWNPMQRSVKAEFLEHEIVLPEAPHLFALLSGAPIFIFYSFKIGKKKYSFHVSEPIYITSESRKDRQVAIDKSVQLYSNSLEKMVKEHPFEWYHFEEFVIS